jgi:predicted carbohydrate-binding protein with CBM5 and CBM33 domain
MIRRLAAVAAAAALAPLVPALPAFAHGAPTTPVSRTAACAAGGGTATGTAACKAALAANGGPFGTFDNLRVPNVDGDDRKFVPDGELCSGGLADFKGLDLARDDFPATSVSAGQTLAINYRATLPHAGSFRIYLTKQGFDPRKKLRWGDLGGQLAEIKDPPLKSGAYRMSVKLPADRRGRQILYIIWQTSSTVDTYYSCSDLVFKTAAAVAPSPKAKTATKKSDTPAKPAPAASEAAAAVPDEPPVADAAEPTGQPRAITTVSEDTQATLGHQILLGALVVGAGALLWAVAGAFLRKRRENL